MTKVNKFRKLKQENGTHNSFGVTLQVSGYTELNMMVSNLLKASIILLNEDARNLSSLTAVTDTNVVNLLEIALQLLPEEEMDLLDDLHKIHLKAL
ncbi:hypothetical protein DMB65_03685 [Flavobacterium cheongpyeongense]|uniref:Uncharacterized protein n=1 Tax=Flavobacterium cheongpyeongense TaxID=2212651 RepID=A0A2V4BUR4_9FLAO|nr:hypothetical protein [Flavobacterium cheongpyeongense]PXY42342.1 hypothetical protein DMB65_03685 [Flavobacterium cheongpyeongense]